MNTLRISPSAYIDSLTLPELQAELVLAASRLVGTRVLDSKLSPQQQFVCHECAARAADRLELLHRDDCSVGMVAHLLLAIAHGEADFISPTHRKEPSQETLSREPSRAAAQEKRPFVLPAGTPLPVGEPIEARPLSAGEVEAFREAWAAGQGHGAYGEPWTVSRLDWGEVMDAEGQTIVDPQGCTLAEPDDMRAMRRIVACVNHCAGVPTEELARETARAAAGGGR